MRPDRPAAPCFSLALLGSSAAGWMPRCTWSNLRQPAAIMNQPADNPKPDIYIKDEAVAVAAFDADGRRHQPARHRHSQHAPSHEIPAQPLGARGQPVKKDERKEPFAQQPPLPTLPDAKPALVAAPGKVPPPELAAPCVDRERDRDGDIAPPGRQPRQPADQPR